MKVNLPFNRDLFVLKAEGPRLEYQISRNTLYLRALRLPYRWTNFFRPSYLFVYRYSKLLLYFLTLKEKCILVRYYRFEFGKLNKSNRSYIFLLTFLSKRKISRSPDLY